MTDKQPEQTSKKKAGSINRYATLGRSVTPRRLDVPTSDSQSTSETEQQGVETSRNQGIAESERPGVEESKRLDAQESEGAGAKAPKRERHTIYFPPELSEWVKIRAIKDKQEISELVTEAVKRYRSEIE